MLNQNANADDAPLIVPLEGVLLRNGFEYERAIHITSSYIFSIPYRVNKLLKRGGWNSVKGPEAISPANLLLDDSIAAHVRQQHRRGRKVFLVSRLPKEFVKSVCDHLGWFSGYAILHQRADTKNDSERAAIRRQLGLAGDFELLRAGRIGTAAEGGSKPTSDLMSQARAVISAIRVPQWSKNLLVFVPVMLSPLSTTTTWMQAALAFLAFSFVASISYIINDLLDLQADRSHPTKRKRPFASGALPVSSSMVIIPLLLIAAAACSYPLPLAFKLILALYFVMTCLYSIYIKRMLMIDVVTLGCLYAIRIVAGGAATGIMLTEWLIAFSVFLFLSLALIKRQAELSTMLSIGRERAGNRSYVTGDFPVITALASSAAFNAVTIFAVFISFETQRGVYASPRVLWLAIPILIYWLSRMVILTSRGKMNEDPIVFASRDLKSIVCGVAAMAVVQLAHM